MQRTWVSTNSDRKTTLVLIEQIRQSDLPATIVLLEDDDDDFDIMYTVGSLDKTLKSLLNSKAV
jgi:hypothetical protein